MDGTALCDYFIEPVDSQEFLVISQCSRQQVVFSKRCE
jgi:hypothetical protein